MRRGRVGLAVHLAQQIQALAAVGEILVPRMVVDLVAGFRIEFDDR
jgi:class 3 adenylate cyclase